MAETQNERTAGAIILRDLQLFNNASLYLEQDLNPEIWQELVGTIEEWYKAAGWTGECAKPDDFSFDSNWVAPETWRVDEEDGCLAWFSMGQRPDATSSSYDLADLCGVGEDLAGFLFWVDPSYFGGKSAWKNFAKNIGNTPEFLELSKQGFSYEGKGVFFLPVTLSLESLAEAWASEDYQQALLPVREALDKLRSTTQLFQSLLDAARPSAA